MSADDQYELRKNAFSIEATSQDLITSGKDENQKTPLQGANMRDAMNHSAGTKQH